MKSLRMFSVTLVLLLGILSLPAMAGVVTLQFTGLPTGNNYEGVASYPYDISVNGGPNQWMMCTSYTEHIEDWETWQATMVSVGSLDPTAFPLDYEAAFLFEMAVADGGSNSAIQAAIWNLFEGQPGLTPSVQTLEDLAASQSYVQGEFANVLLYTAIPGSESADLGTAQDFLSRTPEPGTLALFGSGLIGLAGVLRRKLRA
jgi:PEP-CTERM motif